jgi:hypothetical protein
MSEIQVVAAGVIAVDQKLERFRGRWARSSGTWSGVSCTSKRG